MILYLTLPLESTLAKETSIINAKSASIDHTYKIKEQKQESQLKQNIRKRTKNSNSTSTAVDSSDDEEKCKKKFKKTNRKTIKIFN